MKNLLLILCPLLMFGATPDAATLLDRYIEVTGGAEAWAKRKAEIATGRLEIPAQGIKGTIVIYSAAPDRQYTLTEFTGLGKMEGGFDGKLAWETSALQGPRVRQGAEAAQARHQAIFNLPARWREVFKSVRTLGEATVDGQSCWDVELTPHQGPASSICYAASSGLALRMKMVLKTPMGDLPVETLMSDYRDSAGVLAPRKLSQKMAGQEILTYIDKVEAPDSIEPARFVPPAGVRALGEAKTVAP